VKPRTPYLLHNLAVATLLLLTTAPPAWAQPGTFVAGGYFEGEIQFKFKAEGADGDEALALNPIENMVMYFKGGDFIVKTFGNPNNVPGPMDIPVKETTRLFIGDSNCTYVVSMDLMMAFRKDAYKPKNTTIPTATPTGDSTVILGVKCYGYVSDQPDETVYYYISPQYRVDMTLYKGKSNARASFVTEGLRGCIPLKTVRIAKDKKRTITIWAIKATPMKLVTEQFRIPPGMKVMPYDLTH